MGVKLLVIVDRFRWALHRQFLGFKPHLPDDWSAVAVDAVTVAREDLVAADIIYLSSWNMPHWYPRLGPLLAPHVERTIAGLHSHYSLEEDKRRDTRPERDASPCPRAVAELARFKSVGAVSPRLRRLLQADLPRVHWLQAGVDPDLFLCTHPVNPQRPKLRVGWAGSLVNQPGNRGFDEILFPLQQILADRFEFHYCVEHVNGREFSDMCAFYNSIDVYLCASRSEGASTPVREALACGRPVISSKVGDAPEIVVPDRNGWILPAWSLDAAATVLLGVHEDRQRLLQATACARPSILAGWQWNQVAWRWVEAFLDVLA